jgi:hypothetical protein
LQLLENAVFGRFAKFGLGSAFCQILIDFFSVADSIRARDLSVGASQAFFGLVSA